MQTVAHHAQNDNPTYEHEDLRALGRFSGLPDDPELEREMAAAPAVVTVDDAAEREADAIARLAELVGEAEPLSRLALAQLEVIALSLRVQVAAAGEWRMDEAPRCGRYSRVAVIRRVCFGERPREWRTADSVTRRADRLARKQRLQERRRPKVRQQVAALERTPARTLTLAKAASLLGMTYHAVRGALGRAGVRPAGSVRRPLHPGGVAVYRRADLLALFRRRATA